MKFFRQTKETKRKLSFFLVLAMVISLLPVSPVAKANDEAKIKVVCNVTGLTVDTVAQKKDANNNVTGSAVITLNSEKEITDITNLTVSTAYVASGASISDGNATITIASGSSVTEPTCVEKLTESKKSVEITVESITKDITVTIDGEVTFKKDETQETPKEKVNVTVNSSGLCAGVKLSVKGGTSELTTGGSLTVNKGDELTITVKPTNEKASWAEKPTITGGLKWTGTGATLTATTKITADTTITVSGGRLFVVGDKVTATSEPVKIEDVSTKDEIGEDVSFEVPEKEALASDILDNAKSDDEKAALEAALSGEAKITTSLDVKKVSDAKATEEKNKVTSSTANIQGVPETFGKDDAERQAAAKKLAENGVVLDINLESVITTTTNSTISVKMEKLTGEVSVTMNIPKTLKDKYNGRTGNYYVIRIHGAEITIIPCREENGKITFSSNKFSTYIVTFKEGDTSPTPTPKPGNNNGYIPGPGQSPAPSNAPGVTPSANPSNAPGSNPSNAPGTDPSNAPGTDPGTNPSGAPSDPTNAPSDPTNAPSDPTKAPGTSTSVKVGKKATISGSQYKVTSVTGTRTVQFTKGKKNAKTIKIPATVKVSGKSYKVTVIAKNALKGNKKLTKLTIGTNVKKIGANAFKGCSKLKSIVIKTTKLTKSKVGSNAFKGINAKATIKVPKAKVKAYKKIVKAKGAGKNVKVKK